MKWNFYLGTLVLTMGLCTQSFGFELLDRMLGVSGCCDTGCAEVTCGCEPACGCNTGCAAAPACGCDTGCAAPCEPACGAPACCPSGRGGGLLGDLLHRHHRGSGCCEPACGCDTGCAVAAPACGCDTGCAAPCEPACGCETSCCDSRGGLLQGGLLQGGLLHRLFNCGSSLGCCEPACCEPACGCDSGCAAYAPAAPSAPAVNEAAPPAPVVDPSAAVSKKLKVRRASRTIRN